MILVADNRQTKHQTEPESGAETESETERGCRIKSVNIPCSNGSLELLGVGLETGRQTAGTQTLAELS